MDDVVDDALRLPLEVLLEGLQPSGVVVRVRYHNNLGPDMKDNFAEITYSRSKVLNNARVNSEDDCTYQLYVMYTRVYYKTKYSPSI